MNSGPLAAAVGKAPSAPSTTTRAWISGSVSSRSWCRVRCHLVGPALGLALVLAAGPSPHAQETSTAEPMSSPVPATNAFAERHAFASEWMGEFVYSSDGAVLGVVRDLALRDGSLSHVVLALHARDEASSDLVAVPVSGVSIITEYGIRRVVVAQREREFLAHLR